MKIPVSFEFDLNPDELPDDVIEQIVPLVLDRLSVALSANGMLSIVRDIDGQEKNYGDCHSLEDEVGIACAEANADEIRQIIEVLERCLIVAKGYAA